MMTFVPDSGRTGAIGPPARLFGLPVAPTAIDYPTRDGDTGAPTWSWPPALGDYGIAPTAYDTAWVAGLASPTDPRTPRYPAALRWLIDHQHADGSWGGAIRYEHDRILSTLTALGTLARLDTSTEAGERLTRGTEYLWRRGADLAREPMELVGFELLLPALIRRAAQSGIAVPPDLDVYGRQRVEKLRLIPPAAIYSTSTTLVHSLEFLGEEADLARLPAVVGAEGSVGNAPAATAYYHERTGDAAVLPYLERALARSGGVAVPVLWPSDRFELLWAAYHLWLAGMPAAWLLTPADREALRAELRTGGVRLAPSFPIPDADDTAVALLLLRAAGEPVDSSALRAFEQAGCHFVSFPHERHSSVGVNLHVLQALIDTPDYPNREAVLERLVSYLLDTQEAGAYWLDKWHISPYYATAHAVAVAAALPPDLARRLRPAIDRSLDWLRETQRADGAWGLGETATAEETAYGILALTCWDRIAATGIDRERCAAAAEVVAAALAEPDALPPLWIDKCLYRPTIVVRAVLQSALIACRSADVAGGDRR